MTYSQKNPIMFNEKPASSVKMNEEFVQIYGALNEIDGLKAPLESPALTGSPTAPTQAADDDSTKLATTAYVKNQVASDTVAGMVELATSAEVLAGVDDERAVTPAGFKAAFGEFYPVGVTPTYVDANNFTVAGDLTAIFTRGRVLKITDTGGTFNAICATSAYDSGTELTTVTVAGDTLDNGLSAVLYAVQQATGQIWESGSNANGEYVKFADGTMICTGYYTGALTVVTTETQYTSLLSLPFPATFSAVGCVGISGNNTNGLGWGGKAESLSTTTTGHFRLFFTAGGNASSSALQWFAIGRWF